MQRPELNGKYIKLILEDKANELNKILDTFPAIGAEAAANDILFAVKQKAWGCVPVLVDHAEKIAKDDKLKKEFVRKFVYELGKALMEAVKANKTDAVIALLKYNELLHPYYPSRQLFYAEKKEHRRTPADILRDPDNGFTALHWAAKNKNSIVCAALVNAWTKDKLAVSGYYRLCKAVDKNGQTAYRLAISSDIKCAKAIAEHYNWQYVRDNESDETVFKTLLHDIPFGFRDVYAEDGLHREIDTNKIVPLVAYINAMPELDDEVKERYFKIALGLKDQDKKLFKLFLKNAKDSNKAFGSLYTADKRIDDELEKLNLAALKFSKDSLFSRKKPPFIEKNEESSKEKNEASAPLQAPNL